MRTTSVIPLSLVGSLLVGCVTSDPDPSLSVLSSSLLVDGSYGGHNYKLFVPSGYSPGRAMPLVMMLHGCTQDPTQFAAGTQMNALAESEGFLVVYPEQPSSVDSSKCWNWYSSAHQARGGGQPALLTGLVGELGKKYSIDNRRVYAGGLSAGAAMAVILGATYPDVFAAIAVGSGLEYKAAASSIDALTAMRSGGPSPTAQGTAAYRAMGSAARTVPVIVFHGRADATVAKVNADQIISQWAKTDDLAADGVADGNLTDTPSATTTGTARGGRTYSRSVYRDRTSREEVLVKVMVDGMGHAWSGGSSAGSFTDPKGPDATAMSWEFFRAHPIGGTSPADAGLSDAGVRDAGLLDLSSRADLTIDLGRDFGARADLSLDLGRDLGTDASDGAIRVITSAAENGYAGQLPADGAASGTLKLGDKGMYNGDTFRAILSFDVGRLPVRPIKKAELVLVRKTQSGSVSGITIDAKNGFFGKTAAIAQEDYGASPSQSGVAYFSPPDRDDGTVTIALPMSALGSFPGPSGRLQLRLRATTAIDLKADAIEFHGGSDGPLSPALVFTY